MHWHQLQNWHLGAIEPLPRPSGPTEALSRNLLSRGHVASGCTCGLRGRPVGQSCYEGLPFPQVQRLRYGWGKCPWVGGRVELTLGSPLCVRTVTVPNAVLYLAESDFHTRFVGWASLATKFGDVKWVTYKNFIYNKITFKDQFRGKQPVNKWCEDN